MAAPSVAHFFSGQRMVPRRGFEPPRHCWHTVLNRACLPIPTPRQVFNGYFLTFLISRSPNQVLNSTLTAFITANPLEKSVLVFPSTYFLTLFSLIYQLIISLNLSSGLPCLTILTFFTLSEINKGYLFCP